MAYVGTEEVDGKPALSRMTILEAVAAVLFEPERFQLEDRDSIIKSLQKTAHRIVDNELDEHGNAIDRSRQHRFDLKVKQLSHELFTGHAEVRNEAVRIFVYEASRMGWLVEPEEVQARIAEILRGRTPDELPGEVRRDDPRIERLLEHLGNKPRGLWSEGTANTRRRERTGGEVPTFGSARGPELASVIRSVASGGYPNGLERSEGAAHDLDEALASLVAMGLALGDGSAEEQDRVLFALDCACRSFESRARAAMKYGPVLWSEVVERSACLVVDLASGLGRHASWAHWQRARGGREALRFANGTWTKVVVPPHGTERPTGRAYTCFAIEEQNQPLDVARLAWHRVDARLAELGRSTLEALEALEELEAKAKAELGAEGTRRARSVLDDNAELPLSSRVPDEIRNFLPFWHASWASGTRLVEDKESARRALAREIAERFVKVHERLEKRWNDAINRPSEPTG